MESRDSPVKGNIINIIDEESLQDYEDSFLHRGLSGDLFHQEENNQDY